MGPLRRPRHSLLEVTPLQLLRLTRMLGQAQRRNRPGGPRKSSMQGRARQKPSRQQRRRGSSTRGPQKMGITGSLRHLQVGLADVT